MIKQIPYNELDNYFKPPKHWFPGCGKTYFGAYKRLPRKLKKLGKKWDRFGLVSAGSGLWYRMSVLNPNYHRYLIKLLIEK